MHDYKPRLAWLDKRKRTLTNIYYGLLTFAVFAIYACSEWLVNELTKVVI